jgi:hypothetical protein
MEHIDSADTMLMFHEAVIWELLAWALKDKQNVKNAVFLDVALFREVDVC